MNSLLVPRWSGSPASDWYPEALRLNLVQEVLAMPDPDQPRPASWTQAIVEQLQKREWQPEQTRLVTHSVACHALMMALAQMRLSKPVGQIIMVAGWWMIDRGYWNTIGMNWATLEPWINYKLDFASVRASVQHWQVIIGTDDSLSPDYTRNLQQWIDIGVDVVNVLPHGRHFNQQSEPGLFRLLSA